LTFQLLTGNRNTYMAEKNGLDPPIIASKIRILPFSHHVRTVCMRIELHGCNYTGELFLTYIAIYWKINY
jgi:discoidin domain receptor family protein 2